MAIPITISINPEQSKFIKEKGLSPSKILQDAINKMVKEIDPKLYQENINEFTKKDRSYHITKWQKLNEFYMDDEKKREFGMLLFAHACGQIIFEQVEKLGINHEDRIEVIDKLKEFNNG